MVGGGGRGEGVAERLRRRSLRLRRSESRPKRLASFSKVLWRCCPSASGPSSAGAGRGTGQGLELSTLQRAAWHPVFMRPTQKPATCCIGRQITLSAHKQQA